MIDLYAVLGIQKDATDTEIKRAYRKKSKSAHPDGGGSDAAFTEVAVAFRVLSDKEARARYDATGQIEGGASALNEDAKVFAIINRVLAQVLGADQDYLGHDLIGLISELIGEELEPFRQKLAQVERVIGRAKRLQGRFKRKKGGDNQLDRMLDWHRESAGHTRRAMQEEIAIREKAIALLKGYSFDPDQSQAAYSPQEAAVMASFFGGRIFTRGL
jgi:curved DNA-binding protein CbpA